MGILFEVTWRRMTDYEKLLELMVRVDHLCVRGLEEVFKEWFWEPVEIIRSLP